MRLLLDTHAFCGLWITLLNVSIDHAAVVVKLAFFHRDPFDRLLIAQAIVEQIPITSEYEVFDTYGIEPVW